MCQTMGTFEFWIRAPAFWTFEQKVPAVQWISQLHTHWNTQPVQSEHFSQSDVWDTPKSSRCKHLMTLPSRKLISGYILTIKPYPKLAPLCGIQRPTAASTCRGHPAGGEQPTTLGQNHSRQISLSDSFCQTQTFCYKFWKCLSRNNCLRKKVTFVFSHECWNIWDYEQFCPLTAEPG